MILTIQGEIINETKKATPDDRRRALEKQRMAVVIFCQLEQTTVGMGRERILRRLVESFFSMADREIMLFIGKPMGRSIMISNATNPLKESPKESLLRCAGSTSICVWLICDLVVMCVQAIGDRALGDLCVCARCGSVQSQKV